MADPAIGSGLRALGIGGMPDLGVQFGQAQKDFTDATGQIKTASAEREKALAPVEAKLAAAQGSTPAQPKLDAIPGKFEHKGMDNTQMTEAVQTMFALAALGGAMTRAPMSAALGAFSKGIEGLVKGDHQTFQREAQTFDRNLKQSIAKNNQAMEEYKMAWEKHKGDLGSVMNEWKLIATKYNDTVTSANLQAGRAGDQMKHIESMVRMGENAEKTRMMFETQNRKIDAQIAQSQAAAARAEASASRQERRMDQQDEQFWARYGQTDRRDAANQAQAQERNKIAREKIAAAQTKGQGKGLQGKMLDSYVHNEANIQSIDQIVQEIQDNPGAVGWKTLIPGLVLNRADREGVGVRGAIANITSMTIKDRAGTAQTVSEMKNLTPMIPRDGEDDITIVTKLRGMQKQMRQLNDTMTSIAGPAGGSPRGVASGGAPLKNAKGWELMTDAQGNKAYVGPNQEIEEVK